MWLSQSPLALSHQPQGNQACCNGSRGTRGEGVPALCESGVLGPANLFPETHFFYY